jgi:hypothetical protein
MNASSQLQTSAHDRLRPDCVSLPTSTLEGKPAVAVRPSGLLSIAMEVVEAPWSAS